LTILNLNHAIKLNLEKIETSDHFTASHKPFCFPFFSCFSEGLHCDFFLKVAFALLLRKKPSETTFPHHLNYGENYKIFILPIVQKTAGKKHTQFQTYCKSTFWSIAIITQIILARKITFCGQVWSVSWLRYTKKLTYDKFEASHFFNFEKTLKIRWKTQKWVIFTKMLFSLRWNKTSSVDLRMNLLDLLTICLFALVWMGVFENRLFNSWDLRQCMNTIQFSKMFSIR